MEPSKQNPSCPGCIELGERVALLEKLVAELRAAKDRNSSNSSKPPSSDPPWNKQPAKKPPTGLKPGGQPGHEGHRRVRLPPERVKEVIHHWPGKCEHCQAPLPRKSEPKDPPPSWHQVVDLPPQLVEVTEHLGHARTCPRCGKITRQEVPAAIRAHAIGPRLVAALCYLSGRARCSKRVVQEIAETLFGVPISLGTICSQERRMSAALEAPYQEALEAVRAAPVKYVDETGWFQHGKLCWMWVAAAATVAVFRIQAKRGKAELRAVLGAIRGVVCSDRFGAYADLPLDARQVCWAHLKRDFERLYELQAGTKPVGRAGRRAVKKVFALWRDFKDRRMDRAQLQEDLEWVRERFRNALERTAAGADKSAKRFSRRILKVYASLWTFAAIEGVEPTNNHAERMVRPAVLWRKGSFGNHSAEGCRFSERILTVVQTLHLHGRPVLEYLCQALTAQRAGTPAPALLEA